ncbi:hypothetical protein ABTX81_16225 [Kitasatospora sp. NPDC097605]|uniref:hypothetical protein n=1 Tax=Kitasatospora sp. NPDC097605 TaxID=3157226 RepID=UPI00331FEBF9
MDTLHRSDPAALLAATEGLRARARTRLRGSGVPLIGFGLLALAAVPIAREAYNFPLEGRSITSYPTFAYSEYIDLCVQHSLDGPCVRDDFDGAILRFVGWGIWYALIPLAWFALAHWYRRRGETRGIVPHRGAWLGTAAVAGVLIAAIPLVLLRAHRMPGDRFGFLENDYTSPWYVVGLGLLVLGLTERNRLVAVTGLAHAALLTVYLSGFWGYGWLPWLDHVDTGWAVGSRPKALLLAAVLLAAGLAQWTAERRRSAASRTVTS